MKAYHFIAPALAAVAGGVWIAQQEDTLTEFEEKTRIVKERLQQFDDATSSEASKAAAMNKDKESDEFTLPDGSLDWKAIAELISSAEKSGGIPSNMKTMAKLQAKLMMLDESEIEDGLAKIETLELSKNGVRELKQSLIRMLAEKNPAKALDLMGDITSTQNNSLHWAQQNAFKKLAAKDPAAALAWLDEKIKDGQLVSKALDPGENPRLRFESALLGSLLKNDLATVQARLSTFSEEERNQLFSDPNQWKRGGKMPPEFLELARTNLTEEQATNTIANAWASRHNVELADVSRTLQNTPFSENERSAIVKKSLTNFLQNGIADETSHNVAYEWAQEQSPENAGSLIAQSLASQGLRGVQLQTNFQKVLDLTETFHDPVVSQEFVSLYIQNDDALEARLNNLKDPALAEKMRTIYETLPTGSE
ncbi:hypothetical protein V2O64_12270 [Verrucomicrobiaceae bacterium 227]